VCLVRITIFHNIQVLGKIFFFFVLTLFLAEQFSGYHFSVSENIELSDSEEGEAEKDLDEKENKEFIQEKFDPNSVVFYEAAKNRDNSFFSLLIVHDEVFTPPPKS